jgi:hypothetical protein
MFINEDFPTFDRPIKAYSGSGSCGHLATSVLLITKFADFIFTSRSSSSNVKPAYEAVMSAKKLINL